ncbi:MAG TPA: 50S ribosomal protein L5 [Candidatus Babeliales bacterium]|nr:50S ribosomal protein L5 [Candidatus Babeliales bacterium]
MAEIRLKKLYDTKIRPELQQSLGLKNIMQVPKVIKVVINTGVKDAVADSRVLKGVTEVVASIAGQAPIKTIAKKSIAGFKIREGMPLGVSVTLRGDNMYAFLDKLINLSLPAVRDFQGVSTKLDGRGSYNLGLKEWTVFPEVDFDTFEKVYGMNITIQTSTKNDEHAMELLKMLGMPFRRDRVKQVEQRGS